MTRIADLAAQTLYAHGIRYAFGMPGGEVVTLIDALEKAGIRFVLCRHETAAAIMAAGASAATGAPGLLITTLGPGLANAVNGIADAAQERVPLIVMSGVVEHGVRARYTHQIMDQSALMMPLTKGSLEIEESGAAGATARALRLATRAPQGPVFLQLAPDTAAKPAPSDETAIAPPQIWSLAPGPDADAITKTAKLIDSAERPVILAGLEAVRDGAGDAIRRVMEQRNIPLMTSYKAKGLVDETHPLALGGAGLSPLADKELLPFLKSADLVLLAGYDPIEMRVGWLDPFSPDTHVVEISAFPADHGMHHATTLVEAPLEPFFLGLQEHLDGSAPKQSWTRGEAVALRERLQTMFTPQSPWGPHCIFDVLQKAAPDDALITADSGAHRILLSQQLRIRRPFGLMQSAGFCTMGAAIPLAAGAKIADPARPVIAVLGDGGLEMGLGELATLRDQAANVVIVVLQDESLALIELKQAQAGLKRCGVTLGQSKFEDIAPALGGRGSRVSTRETFEAALSDALDSDEFSVIVCEIQVQDYAAKF